MLDSVPDQGLSANHNEAGEGEKGAGSVPDQGLSANHN